MKKSQLYGWWMFCNVAMIVMQRRADKKIARKFHLSIPGVDAFQNNMGFLCSWLHGFEFVFLWTRIQQNQVGLVILKKYLSCILDFDWRLIVCIQRSGLWRSNVLVYLLASILFIDFPTKHLFLWLLEVNDWSSSSSFALSTLNKFFWQIAIFQKAQNFLLQEIPFRIISYGNSNLTIFSQTVHYIGNVSCCMGRVREAWSLVFGTSAKAAWHGYREAGVHVTRAKTDSLRASEVRPPKF